MTVRVDDGGYTLSELITERARTGVARNGRIVLDASVGGQEVQVWSIRRR